MTAAGTAHRAGPRPLIAVGAFSLLTMPVTAVWFLALVGPAAYLGLAAIAG